MLLVVLIVAAVLLLGGGFGYRGHPTYGTYSNGGIGLGGILVIVLVVLLLTNRL